TDDGKRRVQRHASKSRFSGDGPFLSTRNRAPKTSGGAELAGSGANGRAGGAGAGRQWTRDQARASPGAQQSAQSAFDVEATTGVESDARVALVESIGLLPTVPLNVADLGQRSTSEQTNGSVDELIARALSQRPDLVAKLANVHAKQNEIRRVRAEYYPKVAIDAHVSVTELDVSIAGSKYFGDDKPTFGAFLTASVPIFDGFARRHKMEMAEAEWRGAENELAGARDSAVREVWKAYTDF